jgi:hypothetical protein
MRRRMQYWRIFAGGELARRQIDCTPAVIRANGRVTTDFFITYAAKL